MQNEPDPFGNEPENNRAPSLYALEMVGISAGVDSNKEAGIPNEPEGLLSWMVGIAQAHCLGPRTLVKHLISHSSEHADLWDNAAFFDQYSGTSNGLGRYARMMTALLSQSGVDKPQRMTMLALANLFPANGEGLLARRPQWCPHCLCDQVRQGVRSHFPLVWSFEHYRVCHVHQVAMSEHCPACGATQAFVPIYPSLLHCNYCTESMIAKPEDAVGQGEPAITDFEQWCASALVDLIACMPQLETSGSLKQMQENLDALTAKFSDGNRLRLCTAIGLQPRALNGWMGKDQRPSMSVLLRLCYGLGLLPASLFLPGVVTQPIRSNPILAPNGERHERPMLGYRQRERIQKQLEMVLADVADHRGLAAVANQVGLTRHALKYWFPKQSRDIVRRNRLCEDRRLENRYREDHEFLRGVIQNMLAASIYPSRRRVNVALAQRQISLMRPDLFRLYRSIAPSSR